ncbi:stalk domain-containing protein [Bacillus horti]|uniref:PKD repeat protein n=1 Tax=Caldalkalibacillus horti TaxID=77523 RepID=A0ABT9W352_9BACI|nr:stalk domain-containing protein [Bacillus horti]MDQ0167669.1 PKD repeat protein [Bacillus horti]
MKKVMSKCTKVGVTCTLLGTLLLQGPTGVAVANQTNLSTNLTATQDKLIMRQDSKSMNFNGQTVQAAQPITLKNNMNYIPLASVAKLYGFEMTYQASTKESIAKSGDLEFRFKINSRDIKVNGTTIQSPAPMYVQDGSLMIPIRTWADLTKSKFSASGSEYTFSWSSAPQAAFEVEQDAIYATQTRVTYKDKATTFAGRKIVDERWEGNLNIFQSSGTYVISRSVKDSSGKWSDPYEVTIQVREPNQPPVADFSTDLEEYRMGERIIYTDLSTDDENSIVRTTWTGNELAFFHPGEHEVTLEVEDKHGLTDTITKTITVTDEVLYTRDAFYRLFTPVGEKFPIGGAEVLTYETVEYQTYNEKTPLVLSNSPETLHGNNGIAYQDKLSGKFYFNAHNKNGSNEDLMVYLVATNNGNTSATVETRSLGIGGPTLYVSTSGKLGLSRFLASWSKQTDKKSVTVPAGESKIVLPELSAVPLKPGLTITSHAEMYASKELTFTVVVLDPGKDPLNAIPYLYPLQRDTHMRGTFEEGVRVIEIDEYLGETPKRVVIGDNRQDQFIAGIDPLTGRPETNRGNFGLMYSMKVYVAPNTLIALNPRGGHYAGAFLVNGKVVNTTDKSILQNANEAAVLHRTGNRAETVDISFSIASGSNLPLSMLFLPLNQDQEQEAENGDE